MTVPTKSPIEPRSTLRSSLRSLLRGQRSASDTIVLDSAIRYFPKQVVREDPLGKVYEAILNDDLSSQVALLLIEKDWVRAIDETRWSRLVKGVEMLHLRPNNSIADIQHISLDRLPNVPLYVATEWLDGVTLREEIGKRQQSGSPMPWDDAAFIISSLADAMDYVAEFGEKYAPLPALLYPENIRIQKTDTGKNKGVLEDLGLILLITDTDKWLSRIPQSRQLYFSPEETRGEHLTSDSTIYTLGLMLYEMTHNRLPASALLEIENETKRRHYLDEESTHIPAAARALLAKALAPISHERYETIRDFHNALDSIAANSTFSGQPDLSTYALEPQVQNIDKVVWQDRNGKIDSKPFSSAFITIGSDENNDIIVRDPGVLPRHVCIWKDESDVYTVTDMIEREQPRSRIPTRLNQIPLSYQFAALMQFGATLRVGHTQIKLEPSELTNQKKKTRIIGDVSVNQTNYEAKAGDILTIPFKISYQADLTEELWLKCDGAPDSWQVMLSEDIVRQLRDNIKDELLKIVLPPVARSEARTYALYIRLISSNLRAQVAAQQIFVTVSPEYRFECRLVPETVSTRGQLLIGNQGNATQSFVVQWSDKEGALNFTPSETHVNVRPESTAEVWYSARPRSLHWIGREKQHQIAVQVIPDGGQPQIKTGTVISRALIPPWLIPILFTLLALAVIVAMTMFKPEFVNAQVEPERTPIAGVPITMSWQAINSCFYSVSVNGTTSEWLQFSPGTAQVTLTEQIPGSIIQVDLRNCFFIAGKPWQVVVADPPTPTATPLPAPQISGFVVNTNLAIVGQSGDICFAWQVAHSNKSLTIQPLIGDMDIQKSEFCTPIATTFVQSQTITFSLIAVNSQDSMTSTTLAAPVAIWSPECKVSGDFLNVREGPGTIFPERGQLKNGQIVRIKAQPYFPFDRITQDGSGEGWVEILAGANDPRPAWVDFGYLDCAPIRDLLNGLPPSAAIPQDPTFTPTPTPTATGTPTPLPPEPQFITNVEPKIINQGGCVIVSWDIQQVKEVYLNGAGKMGTGEFEDCPTEDKKYNWHIRLKDDTFKDIELQVKVNPSATPGSLPPPVSQ